MRLKNLDLIASLLVVAMNVGWAQLPGRPLAIGIILAVPLIFVLPGYTLTQVMFRRRSPDQSSDSANNLVLKPSLKIEQPAGAVDHIIFSLGLSMAIDVVMGFILNVFPMGLQLQSWTISLGLVTTVFALLAAYLRRRNLVKVKRTPKLRISIYECILLGLSVLVATVAVWFSAIRPPQPQPSFTQFWMLPSDQAAHSCAVRIGVHNFESTSIKYRITVTMNGTLIQTWPSVLLTPQGEWDQLVSLSSGTADNMHVEGQLYRSNAPDTVYRKVDLMLRLLGNSKNGKVLQCGSG